MKLLKHIAQLILDKICPKKKRTHLFEMLEELGCDIKAKPKHFKKLGKSVDEISEIMRAERLSKSIIESVQKAAIKNSPNALKTERLINQVNKFIKNPEKFQTTLINNLEDAEKYINRTKEIEGLPPINLFTMRWEWKEENQYWVNN